MASTDSIPVPKKNTAFRLYFTVRDSSGVPVTGFTSPDSEVSKDGGAFADCTNEATYVGHGMGYIDLTSTEMNADSVCYYMSCSEGNIDVAIAPEELGDIRVNAGQIGGQTASASGTVTFPNATLASTTNITSATGIDVTKIGGSTQSATDLKDFADTGYDPATHKVQGVVLTDTATNLTNAPTAGDFTATMKSSITSAVPDTTSIANAVDAALADDFTNTNTLVTNNATALVQIGLDASSANTNAMNAATDAATAAAATAAIQAKTDNLPASPAAVGSAMTLTSGERSSIAVAVRDVSNTSPAAGSLGDVANAAMISAAEASGYAQANGTKLGTPAGSSVSVDIAAVKSDTAATLSRTDVATSTRLASSGNAGTGGVLLGDEEDVYPADIQCTIDDTNDRDEYTVQWFRNGAPVVSGVTSPLIQVVKRADGSDLIASTAMTQIGSTGAYKYDTATEGERNTAGEAVIVQASATINGSTRTWRKLITRDSAGV